MSTSATSAQRAPLEDLMVAMDVVDTLRHREGLVSRELNSDARRADMIERLRAIYASQGIEVSDEALMQGVLALEQERFAYTPVPAGLQRRLALIYIRRDAWLKPLGFLLGLIAVIWIGYLALVTWPAAAERAALPDDLAERLELVREVSVDANATARAADLARSGELALATGEIDAARQALDRLDDLLATLRASYEIRVVSRPNELSGVWRVPDANPGARNFYLIVEAVDSDNQRVDVAVLSEENGRVSTVDTWGIRVSEATFNAVAADKRDDGIIQGNVVGRKRPGEAAPNYLIDVTGGAITRW